MGSFLLCSIINKCSNDFNIILIDDDSFVKLIPEWNVDLGKVSEPLRATMKTLGYMKILYKYGGLMIENSFILFKTLKPIYDTVLSTGKMCTSEFPSTSTDSHIMQYMPNTNFIGCVKECPKMNEFINHLQILVSNDYTHELQLDDMIRKWLYMNSESKQIDYIDGKFIGVKTNKGGKIDIDDLINSNYLDLNINSYGLYIPSDELLKRNKYNWFVYLKKNEVLESNTNISKYMLLCN